jgi:hypothetical protein
MYEDALVIQFRSRCVEAKLDLKIEKCLKSQLFSNRPLASLYWPT